MSAKKEMEVISLVDSDDSDCSEKRKAKPSGKRRFPFADDVSTKSTTAAHKKRVPSSISASSPSSSSHNKSHTCPWQPFYLTPVPSLSHAHNERSLGFADLLSAEEHNPLQQAVLMNYMVDLHWMAQQAPQLLSCQSVLCLHGSTVDATFKVDNWITAKVDLGMERYGTHHSKFGLLFYRDGLRIFITTANFIPEDFTFRTQATFVQDLPRKTSGESTTASSAATDTAVGLAFEREFVDYLQRVRTTSSASHRALQSAIERMKEYDFSSIQVSLLPSVPGRHTGQNMRKWGLGKLVKELEEAGELWGESTQQAQRERERTRLCMQFSSVGSMGKDARLVHDYARRMLCSSRLPAAHLSSLKVDVVWPTAQCVRDSLQGYESGNSLPCAAKNILDLSTLQRTSSKRLGLEHVQAGFRALLRRWDGSVAGRERATPHMKCYFKYSLPHASDHRNEHAHHAFTTTTSPPELHWFALTSSNLSQAAWGVFQTSDSQLYVKSYELGVLFLPQRMRNFGRSFSCTPSHPILGLCGSEEEIVHASHHPEHATSGMVKFVAEMNGTVRRDDNDENVTVVPLPVPFVVPPVSYAADDQPWVWDIPFPEPDCLGRRRSTQ